jgi:hypothetical protein
VGGGTSLGEILIGLGTAGVTLLLGALGLLINRRLAQQQQDNALMDQVQEERTHAQDRARQLETDQTDLRERLMEALNRNDALFETNRDQARQLREARDLIAEQDRELARLRTPQ